MLTTGCASRPPALSGALDFEVTGKMAVNDTGQGHTMNFHWQQTGGTYLVEVWGPLGQGRTRLQGDAGRMTVTRGSEVLAQGVPDVVMVRHLGWSVPVNVLPAWIRGVPLNPSRAGDVARDDQGRITGFTERGWQVQLSRFVEPVANGANDADARPGRVVARNGTRRITVAVRAFQQ